MTIWEKMEASYDEMSPKEKNVYELVKKEPYTFASATAMELSSRFGISQSSISRFCQRLGFNGYSDFRLSIFSAVRSGDIAEDKSGREYYDYLSDFTRLIAQTLNYAQLDKIAERMSGARMIFTSGYGNSSFPASILAFDLVLMKYTSMNIPASYENEHLRIIGNNDVLFLFSSGNPSHADLFSLLNSVPKEKWPYLVLVTNSKNHPFRKLVDEVIVLPDQQALECPYFIDLKILQIDFVNIFVNYLNTKQSI